MRALLLLCCCAATALSAPVIVLDPGHGGVQGGATSPSGALEKNVAMAVAKLVKAGLEKELGAKVLMTRQGDTLVQLTERVTYAQKQKAELLVSIHANSMPTAKQRALTQGIETYFLSAAASGDEARKVAARENAEAGGATKAASSDTLSFILADLQRSEAHADSSRLAYAIQESVIEATGAVDRGVQQAPFYVLMGLNAPAVLIEVGFISHPDEGKRLADPAHQQKIADAIVAGVKRFYAQVGERDVKKTE